MLLRDIRGVVYLRVIRVIRSVVYLRVIRVIRGVVCLRVIRVIRGLVGSRDYFTLMATALSCCQPRCTYSYKSR